MSTVFISDSFRRFTCRWTSHPFTGYYDGGEPDLLRRGVHISFAIVQPSLLIPGEGGRPMNDPLSEVIGLLQPRAVFSRPISGAGRWGVRYSAFGQPSFCAVLEGSCRLAVDGHRPLTLDAGDFVLLPATPGFTMSGFDPVQAERLDPHVAARALGEVRHGRRGGRPDVRLLGGWFVFDSDDSGLIVSLLPS